MPILSVWLYLNNRYRPEIDSAWINTSGRTGNAYQKGSLQN